MQCSLLIKIHPYFTASVNSDVGMENKELATTDQFFYCKLTVS